MTRRRLRSGFTLVEMLLAIVLILLISASLFSYLWSLTTRRDMLLARSEADSAAAVLLEQMEVGLSTTFVSTASGEPGVSGDATRIVVRGRGVSGEGADLSDARGVEFSFDPSVGLLNGRRLPRGNSVEPVGAGFERIRFRYFDGREWLTSFDSGASKTLPVAVEIAVWFGAPPAAAADEEPGGEEPSRAPDRVRVVVVPDGPVTAWKEGG